ncbi:MAG TPA: MFS transporter [Streptosporangiaceae bacterium]|nr:MFS transporter [Streptosporangiaceae bacterium]
MPDSLRRARLAVAAYFIVLGLADGVWLARIPAVKQHLGLSDGLLGVALLAGPVGLVFVAAFADRVIDRFGSAWPTMAGAVAVSLLPIALGLSGSLAQLMATLLVYGVSGGLMDVAMNSQAVRVERAYRRPLISSFHAYYSFGGLAGALLGGLFAWAGVSLALTFTSVGVPLAVVAVLARRGLLRGPEPRDAAVAGPDGTDPGVNHQKPEEPGMPGRETAGRPGAAGRRAAAVRIVALALLALCSLLGEGAAGSWSAVYLHDNLGTSAAFAALGYAAFSLTMAFGRLAGDRLAARFGPGRLVSGCGVVAAAGLATALAVTTPVVGLIGFALFGAGLSSTFPQMLSAAGNIETSRSGTGIARVAGGGYLGMLSGPVLIGSCASLIGLRLALGIPVVLSVFIAIGGRAAGGPRPRRSR